MSVQPVQFTRNIGTVDDIDVGVMTDGRVEIELSWKAARQLTPAEARKLARLLLEAAEEVVP